MILIIANCNEWSDVSFLIQTPAGVEHLNGSGIKPCQPVLLSGDRQDFIDWFSGFESSTLKNYVLHLLNNDDSEKLIVTGLWRKLTREERISFNA